VGFVDAVGAIQIRSATPIDRGHFAASWGGGQRFAVKWTSGNVGGAPARKSDSAQADALAPRVATGESNRHRAAGTGRSVKRGGILGSGGGVGVVRHKVCWGGVRETGERARSVRYSFLSHTMYLLIGLRESPPPPTKSST
jgi:hypothetical protein